MEFVYGYFLWILVYGIAVVAGLGSLIAAFGKRREFGGAVLLAFCGLLFGLGLGCHALHTIKYDRQLLLFALVPSFIGVLLSVGSLVVIMMRKWLQ